MNMPLRQKIVMWYYLCAVGIVLSIVSIVIVTCLYETMNHSLWMYAVITLVIAVAFVIIAFNRMAHYRAEIHRLREWLGLYHLWESRQEFEAWHERSKPIIEKRIRLLFKNYREDVGSRHKRRYYEKAVRMAKKYGLVGDKA